MPIEDILWRNAGQTLTPELIVGILQGAAFVPDTSVDLSQVFPVIDLDGHVFAAERYADALEEIKPLHWAHWQETEKHREGLPFAPDYARFLDCDRRGTLVLFTVRKNDELVGQTTIYLYRSMHSQTLVANEDSLFLRADHRGGLMMLRFVKWVVAQLKLLGAREVQVTSKHINGSAVFMQRAGFTPFATQLTMVLGDDNVRQ